ncbi:MAG: nitric oxide reductase activation protein [Lachnospiraceae bacterium]|nr:nitric oxide reductase activation protein [Lachnospiraceae bacterium]
MVGLDEEEEELRRAEAENRIRNLVWTVSGDYGMRVQPDVDLFLRSRERGLYRAVCEGAFFRYYDQRAFSLYLMKKLYFEADERMLERIVHLCMDAAVFRTLIRERRGVEALRRRAAEEFLEREFAANTSTPLGRLFLSYYGRLTGGSAAADAVTAEMLAVLDCLSQEIPAGERVSARPVIEAVDLLYNRLVDPGFVRRHGDLEHVLGVTLEELAESDFDWQDFLAEEAEETATSEPPPAAEPPGAGGERRAGSSAPIRLDEKARARAYSYMELNYGRSYMKPLEQKRLNHALCRGTHDGCSLYFTDGILHNMVRRNYQFEYVRRQEEFNRTTYRRSRQMANRNIHILSDMLRQALIRRTEEEYVRSETGRILPRELWRTKYTGERRIFERRVPAESAEFVVDILMDASGSQRDRRGEVAVQSFILSEALSIVGIPHRVQSFCTCWDYTILQRFREYDDPREKNQRIFEYSTSANNRDGLAVRAAAQGLLQRPEENKILIILSDGRPNDRIVNRTVSRAPALYTREFAVRDTAEEIRRVRGAGVAVLGVFAGEETDLDAEKKIFGRDFAYIRDIRNFSPTVGRYLRRQLDLA